MSRPRVTKVGLLVVAAVLLAACSSSSPSSSSSSTTAATSTTTTVPSGSSSTTRPTGSTTTTTTAPGGPTQCATPKLAASIYGTNGAAGTIQVTVALTSSAAAPCTLGGYPGLQMLDATGRDLPTTVVRGGSYSFTALPASVVTVAAGQAAYFNLGYSDVPTGTETSCPTSTTLEVTPPNSYTSTSVAAQLGPCGNGTIAVSPVFSGTGSASHTRATPQ